jgi:hypothetical protein
MALAVHAASGSSYAQGLLQENAGKTHKRAMLNTRKCFIACLSLRSLRTLASIWRALLLLHNECDVLRDRTIIAVPLVPLWLLVYPLTQCRTSSRVLAFQIRFLACCPTIKMHWHVVLSNNLSSWTLSESIQF